jgi:hypothetical protein
MRYEPDRFRNAAYAVWLFAPLGVVALVLAFLPWSVVTRSVILGVVALWQVFVFPRHHFYFAIETTDDALVYEPSAGVPARVPWREVTHYSTGPAWLRLIDVRRDSPFLFERPLLVRNAATLRDEVRQRCAAAEPIGTLAVWRLILHSMAGAARRERQRRTPGP